MAEQRKTAEIFSLQHHWPFVYSAVEGLSDEAAQLCYKLFFFYDAVPLMRKTHV